VTLASGATLKIVATTLCIHSDSPAAIEMARAVAAAIAKER
jgi:lactam utilization protein B